MILQYRDWVQSKKDDRSFTVRIDRDLADQLAAAANNAGIPLHEFIISALSSLVLPDCVLNEKETSDGSHATAWLYD